MQLTKFTHSCVRLDDGDRALVIDPGVFSEVQAAFDGADAVLVTHEHVDHLDTDALRDATTRNPQLRVWAPEPVATTLADLGEQIAVAAPGQAFEAAGFGVRTFGGQHALIHPSIPVVANVGYLVGDEGATVFHPGDAFTVPPADVSLLLAPVHAPWSKSGEVFDFVIAVRAPRAIGVHEGLLNAAGRGFMTDNLGRLGGDYGTEFAMLEPADTIDV